MITRVTEIKNFVKENCNEDFRIWFTESKQLHVIVAPGNGRQVEEKHKAWTNGVETWYNFTVNDEEQSMKQVGFNLIDHIEGLGLTGWDWADKSTHWVGFDFDSITNHKQGLRDYEISEIVDNLSKIPWVELRYSKSGKGIHVYVHLNPVIPTADRNEHAAVARAIIHKLTALTGFDFKDKIDVCGGNMWVWHKRANPNGFQQIKKSEPLTDLINWQDHIDVIRKKTIRANIENPDIDELTNKKNIISLDSEHKRLIHYLQDNSYYWTYDKDRNMLVSHTKALEIAHKELGFKGIFKTVATGREHQDKNCYLHPLKNGGWVVRRFSKGVKEDSSWELDNSGWTRCYYNVELDLRTAARCHGAKEHPSGAQYFNNADAAMLTCQALSIDSIDLPAISSQCEARLRESKEGKLIFEISDKHGILKEAKQMVDWIRDGNSWKRVINKPKTYRVDEESFSHDDIIRHLVTPKGEDHGWVICTDGQWNSEPLQNIKLALESMGVQSNELKNTLGSNILKFWRLANIPFAPEYPGNRQWNRNGARIRFQPSVQIPESLEQFCPYWFKLLTHIGHSLNVMLESNDWARHNGITTGADYLIAWIASLFQEPTQPLPYLFLYGPQCSGKSILHEALSELIINGVVRADTALAKSNFNAELEAAVVGVIEETHLGKNKDAANKIKDLVTAREIQIHTKGMTPYQAPNSLHFIQSANEIDACPIFKGDTRIQVFYVEALSTGSIIPKNVLLDFLIQEAPNFMAYVLNYQIPKSPDRLNVPVIETSEKQIVIDQNKTTLELFVEEKCFHIPGHWVKFSDFCEQYIRWLGPTSEVQTTIAIGRQIPPPYLKGRDMSTNQVMIGNMSFDKEQKPDGVYILSNGKLLKRRGSNELQRTESKMSTSGG